jgi:hypothetical protein
MNVLFVGEKDSAGLNSHNSGDTWGSAQKTQNESWRSPDEGSLLARHAFIRWGDGSERHRRVRNDRRAVGMGVDLREFGAK